MTKLAAQYEQFAVALTRLTEALALPPSDIIRDSAIQRFEFTVDLAWKTLKTYLEVKKGMVCASPKECFREAYRQGIVAYEDAWLDLVDTRNETSHTYDQQMAEKVFLKLPDAVAHLEKLLAALADR